MKPLAYFRPESLDELLAMMETHGSNARLLAGGTDLIVRLRKASGPAGGDGQDPRTVLIDLKRVAELRSDVTRTPSGVRIGARAVITDVVADGQIQRRFPALVDAALVVGSIQIRNRATIAGNLCNASPAADTSVALLAYGATLNVIGASGARKIPLDEFFSGPGRTTLKHGEVVESIDLPTPSEATGAAFERLTRRRGVDLAVVTLCCVAAADGPVRLGLGAVAPRPLLVRDDSGALVDARRSAAERESALQRLLAAATPISDLRARDDYRSAMLAILARRALRNATERMHAGRGRS